MYCFGGEKLMLLMFKVKNYTSFKNEAILDMRATAYVQHPTHVMQVNDKLGLLKTTALYGANASGKSRACFKTIKVTKQGYKQGKQRHENKAPFSHTGLRNDGNFGSVKLFL